jgi:hypothetical protein
MVIASAVVARPQALHAASCEMRLQSSERVCAHDVPCEDRRSDGLTDIAVRHTGDGHLCTLDPDASSAVQIPPISAPAASGARFKPRQTFHELLDCVRDVAIAAAGGDRSAAAQLSQGKWDRQRVLMGRLELPTAESVRQRLRKGCSWARTLEVALAPANARLLLLNRLQSAPVAHDDASPVQGVRLLSDRSALRSVSNVLHHSPSQVEYDVVATSLNRQNRRKRTAVQLRWPVTESVRQHFPTWADALSAAGLPPRPGSHAAITTGRDPVDVLDHFIAENGFLPVGTYFHAWARQQQIPLPRASKQQAFSTYVAKARARRDARGVWTPSKPLRTRHCPTLRSPAPRDPYTHADRLRALQRFAASREHPGTPPTVSEYQAASPQDPALMAFHTLTQDGRFTFQELCYEAGIA